MHKTWSNNDSFPVPFGHRNGAVEVPAPDTPAVRKARARTIKHRRDPVSMQFAGRTTRLRTHQGVELAYNGITQRSGQLLNVEV